jgi:hypothetical protein
MNSLPPELAARLLRILHSGLVEARNLALRDQNSQISDLADALETLPTEMSNWKDDSLEAIRFNLQTYDEKYRDNSLDFHKHLEAKK